MLFFSVPSFSIDSNSYSSIEELTKQQKRLNITTTTTTATASNRLADPVDILLMKSSLESLPSISDSGILLETNKPIQPLKSPTESRSVHFPFIDSTSDSTSYDQTSVQQNSTNSNIKSTSTTVKPTEKRSTGAISALRRRLAGHNSNSHRRDRSIPEDDQTQIEQQTTETISADDILARYSTKTTTQIDTNAKANSIIDENHAESVSKPFSH